MTHGQTSLFTPRVLDLVERHWKQAFTRRSYVITNSIDMGILQF